MDTGEDVYQKLTKDKIYVLGLLDSSVTRVSVQEDLREGLQEILISVKCNTQPVVTLVIRPTASCEVMV